MRVAIVYDRVNKWGGAERLLLVLHEIFPQAHLFTSVYDHERAPWAKAFPRIHTTFLQKLPFARRNHELLAPLMPFAFRSFSFGNYDLVISVTSEAAKGVIVRPPAKHVCICLTPTRYLWSGYQDYFPTALIRLFSFPFIWLLRKWDRLAAQQPDLILAISTEVQKRIKKYYQRDSLILFPPLTKLVKTKHKKYEGLPQDYFLMVSRLVPYKKVDLVVRAFNILNLPLMVVGTGSQTKKLKMLAKSNIVFLGHVEDQFLSRLYKGCRALIFPQNEDFGLVALEALSFGKPVIAYKKGGALDFIEEGVNGLFFKKQTVRSLARVIRQFDKKSFHSGNIIGTVKKFSKSAFKQQLLKTIRNV